MKTLVLLFGLLIASMPVSAEHVLREVSWPELKAQGGLRGGEIVKRDGVDYLRITNTSGRKQTVNITNLQNPGIKEAAYALRGTVAYKDVEGKAYLEMWNVFPNWGKYFSRTLADRGPLGYMSGSSDGRRLVLPFFMEGRKQKPERLVLNAVMPGKGEILIGPLELVEYSAGEDPFAVPGQWWSERTSGWIGGVAGSLLGLLGALIGILSSTGRARVFVLWTMRVMVAVGIISLVAGVAAIIGSQPYGVWYPLLLLGILLSAIMGGLLKTTQRRYEELEMRKMQAQDLA